MINVLSRTKIAVACLAVVAVLAWIRPSLEAREAQFEGGMGGAGGAGGAEAEKKTARVYFKAPMTADAARVWIKLGQKVSIPFAQETPLEELIKFVKTATTDKEMPNGLALYVDPTGLQEAEKTMASPITINLENVKLETALKLALSQLGLIFKVHPDGLLIVTSASGPDADHDDPTELILDKLEALQSQVTMLQMQLGGLRRGPIPAK
ncbi:MAG: hypothetical protein JWN86_252 [Planctomycetota bacterium]|nr:hypothetical protein [Planctomycetota bacterium]